MSHIINQVNTINILMITNLSLDISFKHLVKIL